MKTANEARTETAEARKRLSEERMARINKLLSGNNVCEIVDAAIARGNTNAYINMENVDKSCGIKVRDMIDEVVKYLTQLGYVVTSTYMRNDIYRIDIVWDWL